MSISSYTNKAETKKYIRRKVFENFGAVFEAIRLRRDDGALRDKLDIWIDLQNLIRRTDVIGDSDTVFAYMKGVSDELDRQDLALLENNIAPYRILAKLKRARELRALNRKRNAANNVQKEFLLDFFSERCKELNINKD